MSEFVLVVLALCVSDAKGEEESVRVCVYSGSAAVASHVCWNNVG